MKQESQNKHLLLNNLNLNDYSYEFTPTDSSTDCTLLYIANHFSYKCVNDINIIQKIELEFTLTKIVNQKKIRYNMGFMDFNCNYLNKLFENISK